MFVPVLLLTGPRSYLFTPLAMAVVFAMLASYSCRGRWCRPWPSISSRRQDHGAIPSGHIFARFHRVFERRFGQVRNGYVGLLRRAVQSRLTVVLGFLG